MVLDVALDNNPFSIIRGLPQRGPFELAGLMYPGRNIRGLLAVEQDSSQESIRKVSCITLRESVSLCDMWVEINVRLACQLDTESVQNLGVKAFQRLTKN